MTHDPPSAPIRLLVVDDSEIDRSFLTMALKKVEPSVQIDEAEDGRQGFEFLQAHTYAATFLDLRMPRLDGLGMLKELRQAREGSYPRVFVLSSSGHPDDVREAYRLNACTYLRKPDTLDGYRRMAERCLQFLSESVPCD